MTTVALNDLNTFEETPFIVALKYNQAAVINFLFEKGEIDVYQQCPAYATPLVAAVYFQNLDAVKRLIALEKKEKGVFDSKKHPGLLLTAIRLDNAKIIEYLLGEGVDINDPGSDNFDEDKRVGFDRVYEDPTPFDIHGPAVFELPVIVALQEHKVNALRVLLHYQPDMNKKMEYGNSANELIQSDQYSRATYEEAGGMTHSANSFSSPKTGRASTTLFAAPKTSESFYELLERLSSASTPLDDKVAALDSCHEIGVQLVQEIGNIGDNKNHTKKDQVLKLVDILSQLLKKQLKEQLRPSASTTQDNNWSALNQSPPLTLKNC